MGNKFIHKMNYGSACADHIVNKLQIVESLAILQHSCLGQDAHFHCCQHHFFFFFLLYVDLLVFIKTSHVF